MKLSEQKELCQQLLGKLVNSKLQLAEAEKKKEKWEAEQEITAAFDRLQFKNEMQRKAFVLNKMYEPNSPWEGLCEAVQQWKLTVYKLAQEYRIEYLMLSAFCQGINSEVEED